MLGKILRFDASSPGKLSIPSDNPFVDVADARPEIWAYGLRNPWRFSFDSGGEHRLFAADAGQDLFEEVDIVTRGGNYGWRVREGRSCFNVAEPGQPLQECLSRNGRGDAMIDPILEFGHSNRMGLPGGTVVIGGYVYRGAAIPRLNGDYIYADFTTTAAMPMGKLFAAREDGNGQWTQRQLRIAGFGDALDRYVLALGQDARGELYLLTTRNYGPIGTTGEVYRLEPR